MARGEWLDPTLARIPFGEWSTRWLATQGHLKPSTRDRYERILAIMVLPTWSTIRLSGITHAEVAGWVTGLTVAGYAASTVRQAHRVLSLALALAVRDGRLLRNAADGVRLPRSAKGDKMFLTHDEVARLAEAAGSDGLLVRVLAYTGLRWGELAALRVGRLDLMRRRLHVVEAASEVQGVIIFGTPKTHQRRVIALPRMLLDPLAVQVARKSPAYLAFTSPDGAVLRNSNFRHRSFDAAAASVGLTGLTPHDLRHTAASLAIQAGANMKVVQQMLGHASAAMTLDVYAGLFGDDLEAVADSLDVAAETAADFLRTKTAQQAVISLPAGGRTPSDLEVYEWGGRGSNPRPRDYESPALTD